MQQPKTILVVDDDQTLREGLKTVLGRRGYRTLEADDGQQARHLIDKHRPDLVILDMMMPRWGGLAVLEHFQGKPDAPRFIMITATEGEKHRASAEELGAADFLHKPFSMDRLLERVERVVTASPKKVPAETAEVSTVIRCRCPGCGSRIKAPIQLLAQTRTCPRCSMAFVVSLEPPEDEGEKLVMDDSLPTRGGRRVH
jgi:DNA-binding response OmpR family regulator